MAITRGQIEELAELARLRLTAEEINQLEKELGSILDYVDTIQELDTSKTVPFYKDTDQSAILRPDTVDLFETEADLISLDRLDNGLVKTKSVFQRDES